MSKRGRKHRCRQIAKAVSNVLDDAANKQRLTEMQRLIQRSGRAVRKLSNFALRYGSDGQVFLTANEVDTSVIEGVRQAASAQCTDGDSTELQVRTSYEKITATFAEFQAENGLETDIPKVVRKHTKNGSKSVSKNRCTK